MITPLIVIGLLALAFFVFVLAASIKALQWYYFHTESKNRALEDAKAILADKKPRASPWDGWYIIAALAAFVGISIFAFIPFLMPIFAFIALLVMAKIRAGEKNGIASFTLWTVVIGAGLAVVVSLAMFVLGLTANVPERNYANLLNNLKNGKNAGVTDAPAVNLAALLDAVRGSDKVALAAKVQP